MLLDTGHDEAWDVNSVKSVYEKRRTRAVQRCKSPLAGSTEVGTWQNGVLDKTLADVVEVVQARRVFR